MPAKAELPEAEAEKALQALEGTENLDLTSLNLLLRRFRHCNSSCVH
jgi:hypothetical protein